MCKEKKNYNSKREDLEEEDQGKAEKNDEGVKDMSLEAARDTREKEKRENTRRKIHELVNGYLVSVSFKIMPLSFFLVHSFSVAFLKDLAERTEIH